MLRILEITLLKKLHRLIGLGCLNSVGLSILEIGTMRVLVQHLGMSKTAKNSQTATIRSVLIISHHDM